jgi:hypothetical protein
VILRSLLAITAILLSNVCVSADTIILRGEMKPINGSILSGGEAGLRIEILQQSGDTRLIPWSAILEIQSARPHPALEIFLKQGVELHRAKQRLLRGDVLLAEPLFSKAFDRLVHLDCKDARLASEGLLRCAVSRGDFSKAVHPWLETVRLAEMGIPEPFINLEPILDSSTLLCPHLPPVWRNDKKLRQICNQYRNLPQPITSSIATSLSSTANEMSPIEGLEDSLFLTQILLSSRGDISARKLLISTQSTMPTWKQVWSNFFIAKGYLSDANSSNRTTGLLHLSKVAAINPNHQPWLSCASMLILSDAMELDGFEEASFRIVEEAMRLFPTHPLHKQDHFQIRSSTR